MPLPSTVPYYARGDPRYDTPDALERRVALLRSGRVVRACRQFWDTLLLSDSDHLERSAARTSTACSHARWRRRLVRPRWREAVADDWRDDLRGRDAMSLPLYLMSIFEVADLWTESVEEWQYVVFLNKLYRRVTKPRSSTKKRTKLWQAAGMSAMLQAAAN